MHAYTPLYRRGKGWLCSYLKGGWTIMYHLDLLCSQKAPECKCPIWVSSCECPLDVVHWTFPKTMVYCRPNIFLLLADTPQQSWSILTVLEPSPAWHNGHSYGWQPVVPRTSVQSFPTLTFLSLLKIFLHNSLSESIISGFTTMTAP